MAAPMSRISHGLKNVFLSLNLRKHRQVHTALGQCKILDMNGDQKATLVPGCDRNCRIIRRGQFTHSSRGSRRLDLPRRSQEFVANLRSKERAALLAELIKYKPSPSTTPTTATETAVTASPGTSSPGPLLPTPQQLRLVAFSNALPFVGFGFFDNAIMIIAGDYIDMTLGAALSISTLAAAGLGNMISDVAGIGLAGTVEAAVSKVGVHVPVLTPEQQDLARVRWTASISRALGITIGCLIGMFPLLFLKTKEDLESEEEAERDGTATS